jgi:hypothetical protein
MYKQGNQGTLFRNDHLFRDWTPERGQRRSDDALIAGTVFSSVSHAGVTSAPQEERREIIHYRELRRISRSR